MYPVCCDVDTCEKRRRTEKERSCCSPSLAFSCRMLCFALAQSYLFVGKSVPLALPWKPAPFREFMTQRGLEENWPMVRTETKMTARASQHEACDSLLTVTLALLSCPVLLRSATSLAPWGEKTECEKLLRLPPPLAVRSCHSPASLLSLLFSLSH